MQACRCGSGSAESSLTALLHQTSAYRDSFVGFTMGPGGVNLVTVNLPIGLSQSERYYCESLQLITHLTRKHMNSIDTLRDAVHSELQDIAAAVRPPDSTKYTRHLPDPQVVDFLVQNILTPILCGTMTGILTDWITSPGNKKNIEEMKPQLLGMQATLEEIASTERFDDNVEREFGNTADALLHLRNQISDPIQPETGVPQIENKVAAELERFHVGPQTAQSKATRIVTRILEIMRIS